LTADQQKFIDDKRMADSKELAKLNTFSGLLPTLVLAAPFWKGFTLGLQSEPTETTWCYDMVFRASVYIQSNTW